MKHLISKIASDRKEEIHYHTLGDRVGSAKLLHKRSIQSARKKNS